MSNDLDEAIEAYRRAAIAEHVTGTDRSASIGAQRAAVVTLQEAEEALRSTLPARPAAEIERLVTAYGEAEWESGFRRRDSETDRAKTAKAALLAAIARPAPVPAAEIERLVERADDLVRAIEDTEPTLGRARIVPREKATGIIRELIAALATPAPAPVDLAALLVEHAEADVAYRNAEAAGLSAQLLVPFARKADDLSYEIAEWTRANLPPLATGGA